MDVPDLVRERLGDEEITAGVSIGDEDAVCLTPTRTLVYRSEGILSDEHVEEFSHDVERLSVKEGRRKTKFAIEYVGGTETFTVPSDRGEKVLELLLQGVLRQEGVLDRHESITGVYRFTELTLVVTDSRVLKHIGNVVWDDDFESYPFERLTGLDFEQASNATSVAIEIDGRPQRVKVPNDTAPVVRQTLEEAVFGYYGVDSLEALNAAIGTPEGSDTGTGDDIGFESDIDPLVTQGDQSRDPPDGPAEDAGGVDDSAVPSRMDVTPSSETESEGERDSRERDGDRGGRSDPLGSPDPESGPSGGDRGDAGPQSGAGGTDASTGTDDGGDRPDDGRGTGTGTGGGTDADSGSGSGSRAGSGAGSGTTGGAGAGDTDRAGAGSRTGSPADSGEETGDRTGIASPEGGERTGADRSGSGGGPDGRASDDGGSRAGGTHPGAAGLDYEPASSEDLAAVEERVEELTEAVERQNELLKRQHKALKQLVAEMRSE